MHTIDFYDRIDNLIPHFTGHVIIYPCPNER